MRRIVLLVVASCVALAACGGSAGADPERFCALYAEIDAQDTTGLAPDDALQAIKDGRSKFVEITDVAPDEIKADVELITDVAIQLTDALIAADGDETKVDIATINTIISDSNAEQYGAASERVDAWVGANCS